MHLKDGEKGEAPWKIQGIPNVDFYQHLHQYLKRWSLTKSATKTLLGQLYIAIDPSLEAKHSRPDNIYRFIEKVAGSQCLQPKLMDYNFKDEKMELQTKLKEHGTEMEKLATNFTSVQQELEITKQELQYTKKDLEATRRRCNKYFKAN